MSKGNKPFDWRTTVLVTAGGAGAILIAAQLLAKPNAPSSAPASRTAGGSTVVGGGRNEVLLASAGAKAAPAPAPMRELFRPLVIPEKNKPRQAGNMPTLPAVGQPPKQETKPAPAPVKPVTAVTTPAPAPAPAGPSASDIQMVGVVELGDKVQVLLKRTSTGESRYFSKGEDAFGFKVEEIKAEEVRLSNAGRSETVAMSNEVQIEGPGTSTVTANSGFSGFRDRGNGGYGGGRNSYGGGFNRGDRSDRGNRSDRNGSGGNGGGESSGFSTSEIMSLPTWSARLKKLEEVKGQMDAERYERLHKFMADRAAKEGMK